MCLGVPELRLSSAEAHARFRHIVFEVNSIYTTLRSHRPRRMRPSPRRYQASCWLPAFSHPSPGTIVRLLPTAAAQRPPPFSLLVIGHHTPLPRFSVRLPLRVHARTLMESMASQRYSISQLLEILSPISTVWLTYDHDTDAAQMRGELPCNDVTV
uniref:Uncharacterized protein n=1 Tax=Oryza glumipatula TaxID=40148 RepID=A0A0D9YW39_9ORYZ